MGGDTRKHAGHVSEEGKSSSSDPRLDVLKACAVLHLHVRYFDKSTDPKNASQATHVERLQAIYIMLGEGYRFPNRKRARIGHTSRRGRV